MNPKQIEAVLKLSAPEQYKHFIKVVADRQGAWGLYEDGWALAANEQGQPIFPLWPAKEYAELCAVDNWAGYFPKQIEIVDLLVRLLPSLLESQTLLGVFPTPKDKGVIPEIGGFESDLRCELAKFDF
jgi:hypothetical protein